MSEKGLQSLCITLGVMIIFWFVLISLFGDAANLLI